MYDINLLSTRFSRFVDMQWRLVHAWTVPPGAPLPIVNNVVFLGSVWFRERQVMLLWKAG